MRTRFTTLAAANFRSWPAALIWVAASAALVSCGGGDVTVPDVTLTVALSGSGHGTVTATPSGISCTNANATGSPIGTCSADVKGGTEVTISATAETGSTFTGWSGDGAGCGTSNPCTFAVSSDITVTATFESQSAARALTVVGGGTGSGRIVSDPAGIDCTITGGTEGGTGCSSDFASGETVTLQVQSGTLVGFGGACSGTACSVTMTAPQTVIATFAADAPATKLGFVGQPGAVQTGSQITPAVQVAIQNDAGGTVLTRTDAITLQIQTNPGGATLGGQLTRNAVGGVATFPDLTLDQAGDGYTLIATAGGLTNATSTAFNVSATPVAHLAFKDQPSETQAGAAINPAVTVEIRDEQNAVLIGRTDQIAMSLQKNPGSATLGGTTTVTAVAGVATFSNLTLEKVSTGYTLAANTSNAAGSTSTAFNIIPGPPKQMLLNAGQSQQATVSTAVPVRPSILILDAFNNVVPGVPITWEVTAGGGTVKASDPDPVVRPTGPLGLSTVVSWTLGPDAGNNNNQLRATATGTGIAGNPFTFTASGTLPPGTGVFKGVLKKISNVGFVTPPVPIANASLQFVNLSNNQPVGTVTSKSDGSFTSPPLPGGNPYQINVAANPDFKAISFAKPALNAGATFSLGDLGMVPFSDAQGTAAIGFAVKLKNAPQSAVTVHVDVLRGYYVGDVDNKFVENTDDQPTDETTGIANFGFDPLGDWGLLTVRVSAPGYDTQNVLVVVDDPLGQRGPCQQGDDPASGCIPTIELEPTP
jgi:uncharacterized repeat protein (TIGR02543 family)